MQREYIYSTQFSMYSRPRYEPVYNMGHIREKERQRPVKLAILSFHNYRQLLIVLIVEQLLA